MKGLIFTFAFFLTAIVKVQLEEGLSASLCLGFNPIKAGLF